ncbi:hypothetical protein BLS_002287 [Venturia inaequalis]|uniref:Uncharacterized protein n=1 Tax=Venturia inaequalis TaxID=5025 RepID=A0A8H3VDJ4_VENIN|nr:hypothetical protein BLS_002287 [Venturia inaequalis]KAE9986536.1 hypothetical protein EG328_005422 [Venturia inaequalis]
MPRNRYSHRGRKSHQQPLPLHYGAKTCTHSSQGHSQRRADASKGKESRFYFGSLRSDPKAQSCAEFDARIRSEARIRTQASTAANASYGGSGHSKEGSKSSIDERIQRFVIHPPLLVSLCSGEVKLTTPLHTDTTTSYTADILSSASSKLVSTRDTLFKRLEKATPESLVDPSTRNLRASLAKPLRPTPALVSLRAIVEKEGQVLSALKKEHGSLNSSINSLVSEILQMPSQGQGNGKEKEGGRIQLHQAHMGKVKEMAREISVLGVEEVREMEVETKAQAKKRAEIASFFKGLDEDEEEEGE